MPPSAKFLNAHWANVAICAVPKRQIRAEFTTGERYHRTTMTCYGVLVVVTIDNDKCVDAIRDEC